MLFEEVKNLILQKLGYPVVDVELQEDQIKICIEQALATINEDFVNKKKESILLIPGQQAYSFPYEPVRVVYLPNPPEDVLDIFSQTNSQVLNIAYYTRLKMWTEMAERAYAVDPDWEWSEGMLYLSPPPSETSICVVEYHKPYKLEDIDKNTKIGQLFLLLATANAKEILGRIRGKYRGVPAPGGTINLDGETLLEEARKDREEYQRKVSESRFYGFFTTG
jgi:hypothetical protein